MAGRHRCARPHDPRLILTLDDNRPPDKGNLTRCGEAT
jgi:hypothetical protein